MMRFQNVQIRTEANLTRTYDAIVVGSGATGGWAAKRLSEAGLNVALLEAGRDISPLAVKAAIIAPTRLRQFGTKSMKISRATAPMG